MSGTPGFLALTLVMDRVVLFANDRMTKPSSSSSRGRPREFDVQAALDAALTVFWRTGYAATSLDDLTSAMGLNRSSFYAAFGSKHDLLLTALKRYVDGVFARLKSFAAGRGSSAAALRAIVREIAAPQGGKDGCLLVNSIIELAPGDREVSDIAQMHVSRVLALISDLLVQAGHRRGAAEHLAGTVLSFGFGATTLRKAGLPPAQIAAFIAQAERMLGPPT